MNVTTTNQNEKVNEAIWQKNGYFGDEKSDFYISKKNSLRIPFCMRIDLCILIRVIFWLLKVVYLGGLSVVCLAAYLQNFILGQLVVAASSPENIDDYVYTRNEAKFITLELLLDWKRN